MKLSLVQIFLFCSFYFYAQVEDKNIVTPAVPAYSTELVVPDLEVPWGMVFLPEGSMLITEIKGKLIHFPIARSYVFSGHYVFDFKLYVLIEA